MSTNTERHDTQEEQFDQEISRTAVTWTLAGILGITVFAMVAMWWLSLYFVNTGIAKDRVLTPVEEERRQAILEDDDTLQGAHIDGYDDLVRTLGGWVPPDVGNTWPDDVQPPPAPRVQYSPGNDWLVLDHSFRRQLDTYGWVDETQGVARVPVNVAIDRVLAQGDLQARSPEGMATELGGAVGGTTATTSGVTPEPENRAEESGASEPEEPPVDDGEGS